MVVPQEVTVSDEVVESFRLTKVLRMNLIHLKAEINRLKLMLTVMESMYLDE